MGFQIWHKFLRMKWLNQARKSGKKNGGVESTHSSHGCRGSSPWYSSIASINLLKPHMKKINHKNCSKNISKKNSPKIERKKENKTFGSQAEISWVDCRCGIWELRLRDELFCLSSRASRFLWKVPTRSQSVSLREETPSLDPTSRSESDPPPSLPATITYSFFFFLLMKIQMLKHRLVFGFSLTNR